MFIPSFNPYNVTKQLSITIIILFSGKEKLVTKSLNNSLQSWTLLIRRIRIALPMWDLDNIIPNIPHKKKFPTLHTFSFGDLFFILTYMIYQFISQTSL